MDIGAGQGEVCSDMRRRGVERRLRHMRPAHLYEALSVQPSNNCEEHETTPTCRVGQHRVSGWSAWLP